MVKKKSNNRELGIGTSVQRNEVTAIAEEGYDSEEKQEPEPETGVHRHQGTAIVPTALQLDIAPPNSVALLGVCNAVAFDAAHPFTPFGEPLLDLVSALGGSCPPLLYLFTLILVGLGNGFDSQCKFECTHDDASVQPEPRAQGHVASGLRCEYVHLWYSSRLTQLLSARRLGAPPASLP